MRFPHSELILAVLIALPLLSLADDSLSPEKRQVIEQVDALEGEISRMSQALWDYSEIALEEMELPYEPHLIDLSEGDQRTPEFLARNTVEDT